MKKRIVVVEDDEDLLFLLTTYLEKAGYEVNRLATGSPIVNNECEVPDLFILDARMRIIDGCALCKYLRLNNRTKEIPVIMISGYHEYKEKALHIGADRFLPKPLNIDDLLQAVYSLTTRPASLAV